MADSSGDVPSKTMNDRTYSVIGSEEQALASEVRRISSMVNDWLKHQSKPNPNPAPIRRIERKLHHAIKDGPLYGVILHFAGLNIWVDEQTPEGVVNSQEVINL